MTLEAADVRHAAKLASDLHDVLEQLMDGKYKRVWRFTMGWDLNFLAEQLEKAALAMEEQPIK